MNRFELLGTLLEMEETFDFSKLIELVKEKDITPSCVFAREHEPHEEIPVVEENDVVVGYFVYDFPNKIVRPSRWKAILFAAMEIGCMTSEEVVLFEANTKKWKISKAEETLLKAIEAYRAEVTFQLYLVNHGF